MNGLGRVDTDQTERLGAPAEADLDGIAVDNAGGLRGVPFSSPPDGESLPLDPEAGGSRHWHWRLMIPPARRPHLVRLARLPRDRSGRHPLTPQEAQASRPLYERRRTGSTSDMAGPENFSREMYATFPDRQGNTFPWRPSGLDSYRRAWAMRSSRISPMLPIASERCPWSERSCGLALGMRSASHRPCANGTIRS
jgi:hypothetical protein